MASIAHVINAQTVEFHRLHSHRQLTFWRYNTKNFSDFGINDLLFFLSSTNRKEKGLLGFGQLKASRNLKTTNIFARYGELIGERSNEEFLESIERFNKSDKFPEILNCLELDNVTYFKSPIYLSDLDFPISRQVESFIYLDTHENITSKILEKASRIGLDLWSETQDPHDPQLKLMATLYSIAIKVHESGLFNNREKHRYKLHMGETLMMSPALRYEFKEECILLHLPIFTQIKKEHYSVLGLISILLGEFKELEIKLHFNNPPYIDSPLIHHFKDRINFESPNR